VQEEKSQLEGHLTELIQEREVLVEHLGKKEEIVKKLKKKVVSAALKEKICNGSARQRPVAEVISEEVKTEDDELETKDSESLHGAEGSFQFVSGGGQRVQL